MQWKRYGQGKESSLENQKILFKFVVYVKINFNKIIKMKGDNNMARYIIPGFRKIETSGGGEEGTTNYNDLTNKPFINNVPLVGNLNTVNLKLTDATLTEEGVPAEAKTVGAKLEEQSTSLTALAEQLGNHTVKSDVPENAVFTDTIYDDTGVKKSIEELNSNLVGLNSVVTFNSNISESTNFEIFVSGSLNKNTVQKKLYGSFIMTTMVNSADADTSLEAFPKSKFAEALGMSSITWASSYQFQIIPITIPSWYSGSLIEGSNANKYLDGYGNPITSCMIGTGGYIMDTYGKLARLYGVDYKYQNVPQSNYGANGNCNGIIIHGVRWLVIVNGLDYN